jgi:Transglutaminase-like superfamily
VKIIKAMGRGTAAVMLSLLGVWSSVEPAQGQVLRQTEPRWLTLNIAVNIKAPQTYDPDLKSKKTGRIEFDTMAIVFPALAETTSSTNTMSGVFKLNDRDRDRTMTMLPDPYPSGLTLARWEATDWKGNEAELQIKIEATCHKTVFDEAAARTLEWPDKGDWSEAAKSSFEPQLYIDVGPEGPYDLKPIEDFVKKAMGGKEPAGQPPLLVAKVLAGEVLRVMQVSGTGLNGSRSGLIEGLDLQGAPQALKRGRGSAFDVASVLTAVYRRVGLPARVVIGYDSGKSDDEKGFTGEGQGKKGLRAWVEFALHDPKNRLDVWVPVDIVRLRKEMARLPAMDKPWPFFGTHEELDAIVPFAYHFFPPTTVRSYGSPAFWGWLVTPEAPARAEQELRFTITSSARRADERKDAKKDADKPERGRK